MKNLGLVVSGTAAGQAIVLAFSPLIARIYGPEVFGIQGVFLSLIAIFGPMSGLRYPMAIVVAQNESEARHLIRLSLLIAFSLSCLLSLILALAQTQILEVLGAKELGPYIWFLPLGLFCVALQDVMEFSATRLGAFRLVASVTVAQAFLSNFARVLGGLFAPVAAMLVAVTSLAPAVQALLLSRGVRRRMSETIALSPPHTFALLKAHRDFPLYRMPTDILNAASQAVPVIMLAAMFSPVSAGLYALTRTALNVPSNVLGNAIGNVLYGRFAELAREGKTLVPLLLRSTAALLAVAPVIVGFAWFAPAIFAFVFGEEWREAGYFARWMSIWVGVALANTPAIRLAPVIQAQKHLMVANFIILIVRILSIAVAFWFVWGALWAVAIFSVVSAIANVGLILMIVMTALRYDQRRVIRKLG